MPLSLVQLQTFRRLAVVGNFTRVAEELYLSQSAVTQQMRGLQEHLGVPLFAFAGRRAALTEAGAFLAERAADVLDRVDVLEREMHDFAAARVGSLELGATVTIGNYALPRLLSAFRADAPGVAFRLTIANTETMCRDVASRRIALALVEGEVPDDPAFAVTTYAHDRLALIVPASGHRFSGRAGLAASELAGEAFVARELGSGTQLLAQRVLAGRGVAMDVRLAFPSNDGVVRAVEAGLGLALLSELAVARDVAAGTVRAIPVEDADFGRPFLAVRLRERILAPLAARFLAFVAPEGDLDNPAKLR